MTINEKTDSVPKLEEEDERIRKEMWKEIDKWSNSITPLQDKYFSNVIDFLKWTTTFSLAAIIWISNLKVAGISVYFLRFSVFLLVLSIIVSIIIVYSAVSNRGANWYGMLRRHYVDVVKDYSSDKNKYELKIISDFLPNTPRQYNLSLLFHMILLLIGIILYVAAMFLN